MPRRSTPSESRPRSRIAITPSASCERRNRAPRGLGSSDGRRPPRSSSSSSTATSFRARASLRSTSNGTAARRNRRSPCSAGCGGPGRSASPPSCAGSSAGSSSTSSASREPTPGWGRFYTANVSVKRELLERVGGFDAERFPFHYEDLELAYRMNGAGLRLLYNRDAGGDHLHVVTLESYRRRMAEIAPVERRFVATHPGIAPYFHDRFSRAAARPRAGGRSPAGAMGGARGSLARTARVAQRGPLLRAAACSGVPGRLGGRSGRVGQLLWPQLLGPEVVDHPRRDARRDAVRRDRAGDDAVRADEGAFADLGDDRALRRDRRVIVDARSGGSRSPGASIGLSRSRNRWLPSTTSVALAEHQRSPISIDVPHCMTTS